MRTRKTFFTMRTGLILVGLLCLVGCERGVERTTQRSLGFEEFIPTYNRYIKEWLQDNEDRLRTDLKELGEGEGAKREALERELSKYQFRLSLGDYFEVREPSELPSSLRWVTDLEQPEIGDPTAQKGGVLTTYALSFPATLRKFGPESNNSFRGYFYDDIDLPLVGLHPKTGALIPGLAQYWALSEDGRTAYFQLDPEARYSDGVALKALDFLFDKYLRLSDNVLAPYPKQYFREQIAQIAVYGERYLSVTLPEAKPLLPLFAGVAPAPPHFYTEYGPDFTQRYQWRFPPTTGAYTIPESEIIKGVSLTQKRVKDWWAQDKKYYRYRFNPDVIKRIVIRENSKALELFKVGQLDYFSLGEPQFWYEKMEIEAFFKGYIEKAQFYNQYPRIPRGLFLNLAQEKLQNKDFRLALHHAMNWEKVIETIFRGDASRLNHFSEGYGDYSLASLKARPYSAQRVADYLTQAGYRKTEGTYWVNEAGQRAALTITYPNSHPIYGQMMSILKEEARKTGVELVLDGLEGTSAYKKAMQKQHEAVYSGWGVTPPFPRFYQFFHSANAFDSEGKPKANTNNLNSFASPEMDRLSEAVRNARTEEELQEAALQAQQIVHDEALFIPSYTKDYMRIGYWRWLRWPDTQETRFNVPVISDLMESHVLWIDTERKKETLRAKRRGETFPEQTHLYETYRQPVRRAVPLVPSPPSAPHD